MSHLEKLNLRPYVIAPYGIYTDIFNEKGAGVFVKKYSLLPEGTANFWEDEVSVLDKMLFDGFSSESLQPRSGFGFAILSENLLNVAMWGSDNLSEGNNLPSLLYQTMFSFDRNPLIVPRSFSEVSPSSAGSFCCWEMAIASHEASAWRRYLFSPQKDEDKRKYLSDTASGLIDSHSR